MIGRRVLGAALAAGCVLASGCSLFGKGEPPKPLVYTLCLDADQKLNWASETGSPNPLQVRMYQLSTPDTFLQTDPTAMKEPGFVLEGAQGPVVDKQVFPGSKVTVEFRQQPEAIALGVVAFYWEPSGPVKARRTLPQRGDPAPKESPPCLRLGPNGIEGQ